MNIAVKVQIHPDFEATSIDVTAVLRLLGVCLRTSSGLDLG